MSQDSEPIDAMTIHPASIKTRMNLNSACIDQL